MKNKVFPSLALLFSAIAHSAVISILWRMPDAPAPARVPLQVAMVQIASHRIESKPPLAVSIPNKEAPLLSETALPLLQQEKAPDDLAVHDAANALEEVSAAYLDSDKVGVQPVLLVDVPPDLTREIPNNLSSVVLRLLINEQGRVDQVVVEDGSLSPETRRALMDGFSKVEFRPALIQEQPVKVQLRIEVSIGNHAITP